MGVDYRIGFSFFFSIGLFNILITEDLAIKEVTLFLKYDSRLSTNEFIVSTPRCVKGYVPCRAAGAGKYLTLPNGPPSRVLPIIQADSMRSRDP
jgi:hypothetical protein